MNKSNAMKIFKNVKRMIGKKSPEILIGLGVAGMITSTVLAVKATPKAMRLLDDVKKETWGEDSDNPMAHRDLTASEVVKITWKCYIPAIVTGGVSVACIIGANSVHVRRNAAIATAYKLSETALSDYKEVITEELNPDKVKDIHEKVAQKQVDRMPESKSEVVVIGSGDVLFMEPVCGKPFKSDIETVRKVINDFNYRMTTGQEEYISLSEFYDEFGLRHTKASDELGWNLGRDGQIEVEFIPTRADDGKPCLMLEYTVAPRYDYTSLY